jgi:ribosome-interacting GTPase 1
MDFKGPYQLLRAKLLELLDDLERTEAVRHGGGSSDPFVVKRSGAGQIALAGLTNTGKSALMVALTSVDTEIGDYPFTTRVPIPGMMSINGIPLQLVDTPAVVAGLAHGEGSGRRLLQIFRLADALALVVDLSGDPLSQMDLLLAELREGGIDPYPGRLPVLVRPKGKGRVEVRSAIALERGSQELIRRTLRRADMGSARVWIREAFTAEDITRQLTARGCKPAMIVGTKSDEPDARSRFEHLYGAYAAFPAVDVSFLDEAHFAGLRWTLFDLLGLMPVYCAGADGTSQGDPVPLPLGSTVSDLAEAIDRRLHDRLLGARIWGTSAQFQGQLVGPDHALAEKDRVLLKSR